MKCSGQDHMFQQDTTCHVVRAGFSPALPFYPDSDFDRNLNPPSGQCNIRRRSFLPATLRHGAAASRNKLPARQVPAFAVRVAPANF